jgi:predicted metal-dependent enzyme (double-stranded beta helix superfamily)
MTLSPATCAIRDVANAVVANSSDPAALAEALAAPFRQLLATPALQTTGVPRTGNHVSNSFYLYYDGHLSVLLFELPKGKRIPAHDHGNWETMGIYRGEVQHTVYARIDDGAQPGLATLKTVEDRMLKPGDTTIVAPPADIHSFVALTDDTWGITIASGNFNEERCYFDLEKGTVVRKRPR